MNAMEPIPYVPEWPEPAPRFLGPETPPAPELPLEDALAPELAKCVRNEAETKGAPPDYVFAALLAVAGATIGNARWVSPWSGWEEPPVIWTMCIGNPSAGKSPGIDAVLKPLRFVEKRIRRKAEKRLKKWKEEHDRTKEINKEWEKAVKAAREAGEEEPDKPEGADIGREPYVPRLVVNDSTIEALGIILDKHPRGVLQMRDELAGWLQGMERYSSASDRPFWLEAYGGRTYAVDRVNRPSLTIERLTVGIVGGIQPDPLNSLLFKCDDDGLLARFLPIWPDPVPIRRPEVEANPTFLRNAIWKLRWLRHYKNEEEDPEVVPFSGEAADLMNAFRVKARTWEEENKGEGLMVSFIGKLPGMAARLALVLGFLDYACESRLRPKDAPREITASHFERAARLVENYLLPMARRAYAAAMGTQADRAALQLVGIIREQGWQSFTSRQVMRLNRSGLKTRDELDPVLLALTDGECIRSVEPSPNPQGGRPERRYAVNPALHEGQR